MTLLDLLRLVKRYWFVCLLIPLICVGTGVGSKAGSAEYVVASTLIANDPSGLVSSDVLVSTTAAIAQGDARAMAEDKNVEIEIESPAAGSIADKARSLTFVVTGKSEEVCATVARELVARTAESASTVFSDLNEDINAKRAEKRELALEVLDKEDPNARALVDTVVSDVDYSHCTFTAGETTLQVVGGVSGKLIAVLLVVGVFLALAVMVLIDIVRKPIMGRDSVESVTDISVLACPEASEEGARLWANIGFALGTAPSRIALVPVKSDVASAAADQLISAISAGGKTAYVIDSELSASEDGSVAIGVYEPIAKSVATVYGARRADAAIVCARLWKDDLVALSATLKELEFAQARIAGIALFPER